MSMANMRAWMEEKMENCSGITEELKLGNKKRKKRMRRRRKKNLPDDELKLLNDLSEFPHIAIMIRERKALERESEEHRLGNKKRKKRKRSLPDDELKLLNDLSGFPHLAFMLQVHAENREALAALLDNSKDNNEEQRSVKKKRKRKRGKRMPDHELKLLNDLSGFPHLAMMLQAEKNQREGKLVIREEMKSPDNDSAVNGTWCQNTVDVSTKNEEDTHELLQTHKDDDTLEVMVDLPSASPGQDDVVAFSNSHNIIELTSPSDDLNTKEQREKSRTNECDVNKYTSFSSAEDILPMKLLVDAGNKEMCKELSRSVPNESNSTVTEENIVLQKLLRRRRYFDMGDENFHFSAAKNRRKPCYVCGDVQHTGNKCRKWRACYVCNGRGHLAVDCPKNSQEFDICLRCTESGHDLFSCNNDYPPDDLKNIVCYVCNEGGHICCRSYSSISPDTVFCYNCGEFGHSGLQCPKPLMVKTSSRPPSICHKCGEEGHAARKCGVTVQNKHQQSKDRSSKLNDVLA